MRHSTLAFLTAGTRNGLLHLSSVATSHAQTAVGFLILLAAILAIFHPQSATAQQYNPRTVQTFGPPSQAQVATDRAAIAAADNARRVAWAQYQARLAAHQEVAINAATEAARRKQQLASEAARREFKAYVSQHRQDAIETAAATRAVENLLSDANKTKAIRSATPKETFSRRTKNIFATFAVCIVFAMAWLLSLYGRIKATNPADWRFAAIVLATVALVLGSFALITAWIPFIGLFTMPTAVTGFALAGIAWLIAFKARHQSPTVLPQIAGVVCGLSIIAAITSTTLLTAIGIAAN